MTLCRITLAAIVALAGATPAAAQPTVAAVVAAKPPVIDGVIDDGEWAGAASVTGFVQYEPRRGEPSPYGTTVFILTGATHVYFGFRAIDPEPLTAQLTQRDASLDRDDAIAVVLDTFHDGQSGYFFAVNVLGTQADARIADDGRTFDMNWDGSWQSATTRTADGWSAEIAVPLTTIRYLAGSDRTWGVNFLRSRRRSLEMSHWAGPVEQAYRISQSGTLTGLTLPAPEQRHQIIPYALTRQQESQDGAWEAGVDARYALTSRLAVYGTLFPDFATVEADAETINFTRFELQLREKRQFFLEGSELFGQRIRAFYSRRISDITAGGKLLGRQGDWTLAGLAVHAEPLTNGERANYFVGRAQRAVGRSNVAIMSATRTHAGRTEGSIGLDTTILRGRTFNFTGQWLATIGRFSSGSIAWYVRPSYDSPTGHVHVRYTHLGDRVADNINAIGQVRDDDRRELDAAVSKTRWFAEGGLERVRYNSNYNAYWAQKTGRFRAWQVDQSLALDLRNRWSVELSLTEDLQRFEQDFRNRRAGLTIGHNTREYESVSGGIEMGRNFGEDFTLWKAAIRRKLNEESSAEYELQRVSFSPDPTGRSTWIHIVRGSYFLSNDLFVRGFFQTNTAIDRRNLQAAFVWRYLPPFGTLQAVYQYGTAELGQRSTQGHTLFLKATTVF